MDAGESLVSPAQFRSPKADKNGFAPRPGFRPFDLAEAESTLGTRFRTVALERGCAVALVDGDARMTYSDLLRRAETVAANLRSQYGTYGGTVAICLRSGVPAIEAMLGALLGGFAYFCMDPLLPPAQIHALLEAAAPVAVLGDLERHTNPYRHRPAAIDTSGPGGIAALYATSGSTGQPKLVPLPHRAVLFDIGRQTNDLCLGLDDRFDSLFSSAFSASLATIFGALLNGAELHLRDPRCHFTDLLAWLEDHAITISTMTVSMLRHLCLAPRNIGPRREPACPCLRLLSIGGEALSARDVAAFRSVFASSCILQNAMASTETRTYAQYFVVPFTPVENPVPMGWPVAEKAVHLIDEGGASVPEGAEGEIVVRSPFIANGYLNDPLRTSEKFQTDASGTIVYRTGDRGRFRADGALVFLGRTDSQVKIRGQRVELSTVTHAVESHPAVASAAVLKFSDAGGDDRLAAYLALRPDASLAERDLRDFLREHLPAAALPSAFLFLPELPLTANGKLDVIKLPPPSAPASATGVFSPVSTLGILRQIWEDVLQRCDFTPEDRFEDLGGDSLRAVCLAVAIANRFGCRLSSDSIQGHVSLQQLADLVDGLATLASRPNPPVAFHTEGEGCPFFFIAGLGGSVVHQFETLAALVSPHHPTYGLPSPVTAGTFVSVESIAAQHADTVKSVVPRSSRVILVGYSFGGTIAFELARQLREAGDLDALPVIIDMPAMNVAKVPPASASRQLFRIAHNLAPRAAYEIAHFQSRRSLLRFRGFLDRVGRLVRARETNGIVSGADRLPKTYQAHLDALDRALKDYTPPRFEGKLVLLRARVPALRRTTDRCMGWQYVAAGVHVESIGGSHYTCLEKRCAGQLARVLHDCAARFEADRSPPREDTSLQVNKACERALNFFRRRSLQNVEVLDPNLWPAERAERRVS